MESGSFGGVLSPSQGPNKTPNNDDSASDCLPYKHTESAPSGETGTLNLLPANPFGTEHERDCRIWGTYSRAKLACINRFFSL